MAVQELLDGRFALGTTLAEQIAVVQAMLEAIMATADTFHFLTAAALAEAEPETDDLIAELGGYYNSNGARGGGSFVWRLGDSMVVANDGTIFGEGTGRWYRQYSQLDVTMFGAVGDGVVNDSARIQAAIDYAITSGETLHFPPGRYLCNTTLEVDGSLSITAENAVLVQGSDTPIMSAVFPITVLSGSITWDGEATVDVSGGEGTSVPCVTVTMADHGVAVGDVVKLLTDDDFTYAGVADSKFAETFDVIDVADVNTFSTHTRFHAHVPVSPTNERIGVYSSDTLSIAGLGFATTPGETWTAGSTPRWTIASCCGRP
jgi:hypothetical protein